MENGIVSFLLGIADSFSNFIIIISLKIYNYFALNVEFMFAYTIVRPLSIGMLCFYIYI